MSGIVNVNLEELVLAIKTTKLFLQLNISCLFLVAIQMLSLNWSDS